MLELKYQGQQVTRDRNTKTYKETFIGDETSINEKIATLTIGTFYTGKGTLSSWHKVQENGPHYTLQLQYTENYNNVRYTTYQGQDQIPTVQLSTRTLQLPLEKASGYRTKWNYMLIGKGTYTLPYWYENATTIEIPPADRDYYQWVKSIGQVDYNGGWETLKKPEKPGVQGFDVSYYVVTVTEYFGSREEAAHYINTNINVATNSFGDDFGLGGWWKLDDAQVRYTGKSWEAINTWTRAYDYWDGDLYQGGYTPGS